MRHDALQFVAVELAEEAGCRGDGGVFGIAARSEGVGGRILDDVHLRHRQTGGYRHLLDDVEEDGGVLVRDLFGAGGS